MRLIVARVTCHLLINCGLDSHLAHAFASIEEPSGHVWHKTPVQLPWHVLLPEHELRLHWYTLTTVTL